MKKSILTIFVLLIGAFAALGQQYKPVLSENIPPQAAEVLMQRIPPMLETGDLSVCADGVPLHVDARVNNMSVMADGAQVALTLELVFSVDDVKSDPIPLKGVGSSEEDAWLRAVKQFLPRSKAALGFVQKLK